MGGEERGAAPLIRPLALVFRASPALPQARDVEVPCCIPTSAQHKRRALQSTTNIACTPKFLILFCFVQQRLQRSSLEWLCRVCRTKTAWRQTQATGCMTQQCWQHHCCCAAHNMRRSTSTKQHAGMPWYSCMACAHEQYGVVPLGGEERGAAPLIRPLASVFGASPPLHISAATPTKPPSRKHAQWTSSDVTPRMPLATGGGGPIHTAQSIHG
jgi:hypothetical protein